LIVKAYVPKQGDVVWLDFNPQFGHEQAGRRPALVISPESYNAKIGLMLCCPITNQAKGYPFEVVVRGTAKVTGVVLADQVKSFDWAARSAEFKGKVSPDVLAETVGKFRALVETE